MKGYGGRERAPTNPEIPLGSVSLRSAIAQADFLNEVAPILKTKFVKLPLGWGVGWASYDQEKRKIKSLVEVGAIDLKFSEAPEIITYPVTPFILIPTILMVTSTVVLLVKFQDCAAYRTMFTAEERQPSGQLLHRIGTATGEESLQPVIEIPVTDFIKLEK